MKRAFTSSSLLVCLLGGVAAAQGEDPHGGQRRYELALAPQPGWKVETPSSGMRAAQFLLPAREGGQDLQLVVYHFGRGQGGTVEANMERWLKQLQPAEKDAAPRRAAWAQHGLALHTVEADGTFVAETRPGSGERRSEPGWRLLGAVVEGADGPYFVKLVGPRPDVERWSQSYRAFLEGLNGGKQRALRFAAPRESWRLTAPSSGMRVAEFHLPPAAQQGEGPTVVVYHFGKGQGGTVEANFTRWAAQFEGASQPARGKREAGGLVIHTLALEGTHLAGAPGASERRRLPGYALRAAVIEGEDGPYFVKMVGPASAVKAAEKDLEAFYEKGVIRPRKDF